MKDKYLSRSLLYTIVPVLLSFLVVSGAALLCMVTLWTSVDWIVATLCGLFGMIISAICVWVYLFIRYIRNDFLMNRRDVRDAKAVLRLFPNGVSVTKTDNGDVLLFARNEGSIYIGHDIFQDLKTGEVLSLDEVWPDEV